MKSHNLSFAVHNNNLAPSYLVPAVEAYQSQKNILVLSNPDPLGYGLATSGQAAGPEITETRTAFFSLRLEMALNQPTSSQPSYFPGAIIPGPGGASCSEVKRGNLLFDQFQYLLGLDSQMLERISQYQADAYKGTYSRSDQSTNKSTAAPSRLFCIPVPTSQAWPWHYAPLPELYFLHQTAPLASNGQEKQQAIANFTKAAGRILNQDPVEKCSDETLRKILALIADAWFSPHSGQAPISWGSGALAAAKKALLQHRSSITEANLLPFLFELEAMASHISLAEDKVSFARGVFAGNFIDVSLAPITGIKATEFCVGERLFDEVINLSSRGFAPVVINEYGLVADGNHRLTASYVWNILKYAQDLDWSLENDHFQRRVATFATAVQNGLLKYPGQVSPVSLHQTLSHLSYFLCRPDCRARLNSYTRPLLKRHDFIHALPVILLPEYLSGAVVKSLYDTGESIERACPSLYEAMSLNNHLVLPPRASYHFTDAALLPWFTVLKSRCGTRRRTSAFGHRARAFSKN